MKDLNIRIAFSHLKSRKRQTLVSILGVATGVAFFIAISGMMGGFQDYLREQLIEAYPHIIVTDEYREAAPQPSSLAYPDALVEVKRRLPRDPVRGISSAPEILEALSQMPGVIASGTLRGQLLLRRAGRDYPVSALGINPEKEQQVTQLRGDLTAGSFDALATVPDGIVLGGTLAHQMDAHLNDTVNAVSPSGVVTQLRVVGIYQTGLENLDSSQVYVGLTKQQAMQDRARVVNEIRIHLDNFEETTPLARQIEQRWTYKAAPWEETNARILSVFVMQNAIIFPTVGAILIVAGFGIFNIIATVVLEKAREIAIMRSIGMRARDLAAIFMMEGLLVGLIGTLLGWLGGYAMAEGMRMIEMPHSPLTSESGRNMIVNTELWRFALAGGLAIFTSILAAFLPAKKAAQTNPLDIIRGAN